ncbi:MAG: ferredoxin--NADP reductase [Leptospirillum sp.]|jgi:ferredoxin-NADP reductase|nr:FAD-binding oxidoreductase [Nitrospiraceae bacterium]
MAKREVLESSILSIIPETPRVNTYRLGVAKGTFSFMAGQFLMASIPDFLRDDGRPVRRAYSIASSPLDLQSGYLELTVTKVGDGGYFSNRLHESRVGDPVLIEGPYGKAFHLAYPPEAFPQRYLFVGSGSGVAPLRAMIRTLLKEGCPVPIELFYGYRNGTDCIYEEEIRHWQEKGVTVHLAISGSPTPGKVFSGSFGRITSLLPVLIPSYAGQEVFICGPPAMVEETVDFFNRMKFPEGSVHKEQW